jgi:hypothetical protein
MSKFKIAVSATQPTAAAPASIAAFGDAAAMAQSQAGGREPRPIRLNLDLSPEVHKALKRRAVDQGESVASVVRRLITQHIG